MKRIVITTLTVILLFMGAGNTFAMEEDNQNGNAYGKMNVGQMLQKHGHDTVAETKEMYLKHHGTLGAKPSKNFVHHDECMEMEK